MVWTAITACKQEPHEVYRRGQRFQILDENNELVAETIDTELDYEKQERYAALLRTAPELLVGLIAHVALAKEYISILKSLNQMEAADIYEKIVADTEKIIVKAGTFTEGM